MDNKPLRGKCLCGQIEFEIKGVIPKFYQCHCSLCRKQGGTSSNTATIVDSVNFQWIEGEGLISSWVNDTGFRSDFCSHCGSPVPNPLRNSPYYWVPAGLLEDGMLEICAHLFVGSKASWDMIPPNGMQFETMPEFSQLMAVVGVNGHGQAK